MTAPPVIYKHIILISIRWCAVLVASLVIVARLTQRLPVVLIPHQVLVTTMRNNMVNYRCLYVFTLGFALLTQRMFLQEQLSLPLPL